MNRKELIDLLVKKFNYSRAGLNACDRLQLIKIAHNEDIQALLPLGD